MNQPKDFTLVEIMKTVKQQVKPIASFVGLIMLLAFLLLFFVLPKYYKSQAVIVAANPALSDKSRLLSTHIQHLYSPYGSDDDLERLVGIANMDTVFLQLVNDFRLVDYYDLDDVRGAHAKAVEALRDDIDLLKTEHNALQILVSTKDRHLSANLANRLVELVSSIAQLSWRQEYAGSIKALQSTIERAENELQVYNLELSRSNEQMQVLLLTRRAAQVEQLQQFHKSLQEYKLALENQAPAVVVLQNAKPASIHHKPRKLPILAATFLLAVAFAVLVAVAYKNKTSQ